MTRSEYDPNICPYFCSKFTSSLFCDEEHEAWHVQWIQAAITEEEYIRLVREARYA